MGKLTETETNNFKDMQKSYFISNGAIENADGSLSIPKENLAKILYKQEFKTEDEFPVHFDKDEIDTIDGIIDFLVFNAGSLGRFLLFDNYKKHLSSKVYWHGLAYAYTNSDNLFKYRYQVKKCFLSKKPDREFLMDDDEKAYLAKLPNKIRIYRAMCVEEFNTGNYNISWTLKKSVALFFRDKYWRNFDTKNQKKVVVEMVINKKDVVAFFNDRNEYEIIYINK